MNTQPESTPGARWPLNISGKKEIMVASYEKQAFLDSFIKPVPLKEALESLTEKTGVDFYEFYIKDYNIPPTREKVEQERARTTLAGDDEDFSDVRPYFKEQEGRRYYRYIGYRYNPDKKAEDCDDFLIVEENLPKGKILAIFDYKSDPNKILLDNDKKGRKIPYRKLLGCYAIIPGSGKGENQAIDLISFWTGVSIPSDNAASKLKAWGSAVVEGKALERKYPDVKTEKIKEGVRVAALADENRLVSIGIAKQGEDVPALDPVTQMNLLKEKGRFLFADQAGPEKWLQLLYTTAAFSQNEGDKMPANIRTDLPLGAIRSFLGETEGAENELIEEFLASAEKQRADLRQVLTETRDWMRNRVAVTLYLVKRFHNLEIDFVPKERYGEAIKMLNHKLDKLKIKVED